jgi:hypothetical protein
VNLTWTVMIKRTVMMQGRPRLVHAPNEEGLTPLMTAAMFADYRMVRRPIKN